MRDDINSNAGARRTPGRPREFDEVDILQRLVNLFWDKGYEATSLSDIVTTTGLKKGSLYSLFGGKHDMYMKSLAYYNREYVQAACKGLTNTASGLPRERLDVFLSSPIKALSEDNDQRGCFLCNSAAEMVKYDSEVRQSVAKAHDDMLRALKAVLLEESPLQEDEKISKRARALLVTYTGLRILARTRPDLEILRDAKEAALEF